MNNNDPITEGKPFALIIEDDFDAAEIIDEALLMAGFETEIIRDGKMALARLTEIVPNVITLDLHLPHASGIEILQHIRGDKRLEKVPVMVVTADARLIDQAESMANLVLIKPASFNQVRLFAQRLSRM